jgi:hypothetical protein
MRNAGADQLFAATPTPRARCQQDLEASRGCADSVQVTVLEAGRRVVAAIALATLSVVLTAGSTGAAWVCQAPGANAPRGPTTVVGSDPASASSARIIPLPRFQDGSARVQAKPWTSQAEMPIPIDTGGVLGPAEVAVRAAGS